MKEIDRFNEAIHNAGPLLSDIKKNKKIIGYVCSYAPEELIYAAGWHPMRLFPSQSDIILAEQHLQVYCCSLVRGILEDSLIGRLDFLDGAVFPHTCDTIQRLSDIWRLNQKYEFFWDVVLPVKLNTQSARNYMVDILNRFKKDLETAIDSPITKNDLMSAVGTYNSIRKNLSRIYRLQCQTPGIIKSQDLLTLVKGSMIMERHDAESLLQKIRKTLEKKKPVSHKGKRILISGAVCDRPDIYQIIESSGGMVVADDLCTGQRWFDGEIQVKDDPVVAIANRYADRMICPAKHIATTARGEHLVLLAKKVQADGVIFTFLKFCDPHAFDLPYLKEYLDQAGIKTLHLDLDGQQQSPGQFSTRIETFIHML